jgi:murein DD-endopeptidase MepM/ murein hydrolase activator NlpD
VYSHLSSRNVNIGEVVTAGQLLGSVGSTGRATGAHLHWEVWVNGTPVDPLQWVYQPFP